MTPTIGDTVTLKSGSPEMTVEITGDHLTACVWFEDGDLMRETFPTAGLLVKPKRTNLRW